MLGIYCRKMDRAGKVSRRRELRKRNRDNTREILFVADYVQTKYPVIYAEGVGFYQSMNRKYPNKNDLRKTAVYKDWKAGIVSQQYLPSQSTVIEGSRSQHPSEGLSDHYMESSCQESQPPRPEQESLPPGPSEEPLMHDVGETQPGKPKYNDNLLLRIPLIHHESGNKTAKKPEEIHALGNIQPTLLEDMEEIHTVGNIQPTLPEDISPELIDNIIEELRTEPGLNDFFRNIEENLLFEQLGTDIDIPEQDLLELELKNW